MNGSPDIFQSPAFLDAQTCRRIRDAMNAGAVDDAEVVEGDRLTRRVRVRRASSIEISETLTVHVERRLDALRPELMRFFEVPLSSREGVGFVRYPPGGFYALHRDRADSPAWPDAARRRISVVTFLNASRDDGPGDFDGGRLRVHGEGGAVEVSPREGLLIAFAADLLHQVTTVRGGTRDVIVDWFYEA